MKKPSISIIIPVYNVEPYIEACLNSVIHQSYDRIIECIVVDDCGSDNSMNIADKVIANYNGSISFKIVHHDCNRGLSAARNTGMDAAIGDYLFFLDSDDYISDECIERLVEPLNNYQFDLVIGNYQHVDENKNNLVSDYIIKISDKTMLLHEDILHAYSLHQITPLAWGRLIHSDFVRSNKLYFMEGILHEDELWSFQVFNLSKSLFFVNQKLYYYRIRKRSITNSKTNKSIDSLVTIVVEMGKLAKKRKNNYKENFKLIRDLFYQTLNANISTSIFIRNYKIMHQYILPSKLYFLKLNWNNPQRFIRDFHLLLPSFLAPYCEYGIKKFLM